MRVVLAGVALAQIRVLSPLKLVSDLPHGGQIMGTTAAFGVPYYAERLVLAERAALKRSKQIRLSSVKFETYILLELAYDLVLQPAVVATLYGLLITPRRLALCILVCLASLRIQGCGGNRCDVPGCGIAAHHNFTILPIQHARLDGRTSRFEGYTLVGHGFCLDTSQPRAKQDLPYAERRDVKGNDGKDALKIELMNFCSAEEACVAFGLYGSLNSSFEWTGHGRLIFSTESLPRLLDQQIALPPGYNSPDPEFNHEHRMLCQ
jgi:hypothetical protein